MLRSVAGRDGDDDTDYDHVATVYNGGDHFDDRVPVVHHHYGGDDIHHSPVDHRGYNDDLYAVHHDHLVVYEYDDEYLYDPVHHYLFDLDQHDDELDGSGADDDHPAERVISERRQHGRSARRHTDRVHRTIRVSRWDGDRRQTDHDVSAHDTVRGENHP